ncbi:winged helix-turn-helix transcriptional regulator [Novosphingobium sp. Leaf2]|uniref:winged helix-turn-helix transcriptional regulator n=1 Tax=Novosphingobium sp. Leaf2 TaxID=1735670 RepID=UPI001F2B51B9|nr:winged helix-turn-helix transcriptional regulator [Novosphingobium sp. Leaf2]
MIDSAPSKRRYDDACAAVHAMDLVGERWALPVIRELMLGPRRFSELRRSLPGISANVLTQRLEGLEAAGVVLRETLPSPARVQVYGLTEWGQESLPVFEALGRWAARSPRHDPTAPFSPVALILSLRTMIDPVLAKALNLRLGFRFDDDTFHFVLSDGTVTAGRGLPDDPEIVFSGNPSGVAALIYTDASIAMLESAGLLLVEGNRERAAGLGHYFPLPDKALVC